MALFGMTSEKRKRPDDLLSSVVRETALPGTVELLRSNQQFAFPSGTAWLALLLSASAIGGLSKRHSRDEAKGSIIELIESDQIHTVATEDMLKEEVFGIIPTPQTLDRMEEYSLLTSADYSWAVLWLHNTSDLVIDVAAEATFAQAQQVAAGLLSLEDIVGSQVWVNHGGSSSLATPPTFPGMADGPQTPGPAEEFSAEEFAADPVAYEQTYEADQMFAKPDHVRPEFDDAIAAPVAEFDSELAPTYGDAADRANQPDVDWDDHHAEREQADGCPDVDDGLTVDESEVRQAIARRFLGEDLELSVNLDEFDRVFAVGDVVRFEEPNDTATPWLSDQVAQLARQANAEIARQRDENLRGLRALFVDLMSRHAEEVMAEVSTTREGSYYHQLSQTAQAEHEGRKGVADQQVRDRRTEISRDFEECAKLEGERAAKEAEARYKERHRAAHERNLAESGAEVERLNEEAYAHAQLSILELRRRDAQAKLELGQTRVFRVLMDTRADYDAAERKLVEKWNAEILRTIDLHRKDDVSRAEALAEQQARANEVAQLKAEQSQAVATMSAQHADRVRRMEAELERLRSEAIVEMRRRDGEWQHNLALERAKAEHEATRVRDLMLQLDHTSNSIRGQYEARIAELETDRRSFSDELDRASLIQSRSNKVLSVLVIFMALFMAAAGFIVGAARVW